MLNVDNLETEEDAGDVVPTFLPQIRGDEKQSIEKYAIQDAPMAEKHHEDHKEDQIEDDLEAEGTQEIPSEEDSSFLVIQIKVPILLPQKSRRGTQLGTENKLTGMDVLLHTEWIRKRIL